MEEFERLREFIKVKFYDNNAELARALEMKPQSIQAYLSGKQKVGGNLQDKLKNLGLNPQWLKYGEGEMLLKEKGNFSEVTSNKVMVSVPMSGNNEDIKEYIRRLKAEKPIVEERLKYINKLIESVEELY